MGSDEAMHNKRILLLQNEPNAAWKMVVLESLKY